MKPQICRECHLLSIKGWKALLRVLSTQDLAPYWGCLSMVPSLLSSLRHLGIPLPAVPTATPLPRRSAISNCRQETQLTVPHAQMQRARSKG